MWGARQWSNILISIWKKESVGKKGFWPGSGLGDPFLSSLCDSYYEFKKEWSILAGILRVEIGWYIVMISDSNDNTSRHWKKNFLLPYIYIPIHAWHEIICRVASLLYRRFKIWACDLWLVIGMGLIGRLWCLMAYSQLAESAKISAGWH